MIAISPRLMLIGAAGAIVLAIIGAQVARVALLKRDVAQLRAAEHAASQAAGAWQRTTEAERGERAKEAAHARTTQEILDDERNLSAAARADADAARGDADQLRAAARQYAAARRCPVAADPAAAGSSQPTADPGDLFADVLGGLAADGAALAAEADRRGIAGLTCWRERAPLTTAIED